MAAAYCHEVAPATGLRAGLTDVLQRVVDLVAGLVILVILRRSRRPREAPANEAGMNERQVRVDAGHD